MNACLVLKSPRIRFSFLASQNAIRLTSLSNAMVTSLTFSTTENHSEKHVDSIDTNNSLSSATADLNSKSSHTTTKRIYHNTGNPARRPFSCQLRFRNIPISVSSTDLSEHLQLIARPLRIIMDPPQPSTGLTRNAMVEFEQAKDAQQVSTILNQTYLANEIISIEEIVDRGRNSGSSSDKNCRSNNVNADENIDSKGGYASRAGPGDKKETNSKSDSNDRHHQSRDNKDNNNNNSNSNSSDSDSYGYSYYRSLGIGPMAGAMAGTLSGTGVNAKDSSPKDGEDDQKKNAIDPEGLANKHQSASVYHPQVAVDGPDLRGSNAASSGPFSATGRDKEVEYANCRCIVSNLPYTVTIGDLFQRLKTTAPIRSIELLEPTASSQSAGSGGGGTGTKGAVIGLASIADTQAVVDQLSGWRISGRSVQASPMSAISSLSSMSLSSSSLPVSGHREEGDEKEEEHWQAAGVNKVNNNNSSSSNIRNNSHRIGQNIFGNFDDLWSGVASTSNRNKSSNKSIDTMQVDSTIAHSEVFLAESSRYNSLVRSLSSGEEAGTASDTTSPFPAPSPYTTNSINISSSSSSCNSNSNRNSNSNSNSNNSDGKSNRDSNEASGQQRRNRNRTKIFVKNLGWDVNEDDLMDLFSGRSEETVSAGMAVRVIDAHIIRRNDHRSQGCAIVSLGSDEEAEAVLRTFNQLPFRGRPMSIEYCKDSKQADGAVIPLRVRFDASAAVFVDNLPKGVGLTFMDLSNHFRSVAPVQFSKINTDDQGRELGSGFVQFANAGDAQAASKLLNNSSVQGSTIFARMYRQSKN